MGTTYDMVMDEAIAWHLGLDQAGAEEWRRFTAWLESDSAHAEAYDRLTLDDAALEAPIFDAAFPPLVRRRERIGGWMRWGGAGGGLIAAAAAAAWLLLMPAPIDHAPYSIETAPGVHRGVTLADGTRVDLNGGTRLTLDRDTPRVATLDQGEAIFHVVHHAGRPFEVRSGDTVLRDVGTVFNVVRQADATDVAVAEGSVVYDPAGAGVKLTAGRTLHDPDRGPIEIGDAPSEAIGAWRRGRLIYRDAPLATVAGDLARATGHRLTVDPALAARSFTGTIAIRGVDRSQLPVRLARLAGAQARHDAAGWRLTPERDTAR